MNFKNYYFLEKATKFDITSINNCLSQEDNCASNSLSTLYVGNKQAYLKRKWGDFVYPSKGRSPQFP
jgi:hypothetical protein